jgi:serine/threonine protein kinase
LRIRQYEVREIVASGGMGTVYRAHDFNLDRRVAIKLLKKELAEDKEVLESFYREARAGAALNHTHIIHVYAFEEFEGRPFMVMELADHGSLDSRIEKEGLIPELAGLDIGERVASALDSALKRGFLHRDIKPGNILFDDAGEPKLVDFGLARAADDSGYESTVWGTPYYVAPEKIQRQGETFLSDMYSLGGTLYHALTGHVPFEAETVEGVVYAHVGSPLTPPHEVNTSLSRATSEVIVKAMAKRPKDRFASYDLLIAALYEARAPLLRKKYGIDTPPAEPTEPGAEWWKE